MQSGVIKEWMWRNGSCPGTKQRRIDIKECYRRWLHSAIDEGPSLGWESRLYLWAPGPKSLGCRDGSPSNSVSDLGSLDNIGRVGYDGTDRAKHELLIRSPEAVDIRAMIRKRKLRGGQHGARGEDEAVMGRVSPSGEADLYQ